MELGSSKVNVGSHLTGSALMMTMSSALQTMCLTPTSSGACTGCTTGVVVFGEATWLDSNKEHQVDLTIKVTRRPAQLDQLP